MSWLSNVWDSAKEGINNITTKFNESFNKEVENELGTTPNQTAGHENKNSFLDSVFGWVGDQFLDTEVGQEITNKAIETGKKEAAYQTVNAIGDFLKSPIFLIGGVLTLFFLLVKR
jgi:hypothetical protein